MLTARAAEFEAGFAWGVVRQLFEPAIAGAGPDGAHVPGPGGAVSEGAGLGGAGPGGSAIAGARGPGLLPEGAAQLAAPALSHDVRQGEQDSFAVLHGLYWLTATMAQQAPLLLAIDDLHWADEPSQRFVAHLAHRLDGLPVLLLVTAREPGPATTQAAGPIAGLAREPDASVLRPAALGEGCLRRDCPRLPRWPPGRPAGQPG